MKRKICFVITSGIHYARNKKILQEIQRHPDLELQIVVGGSALLSNYGDVLTLLEEDGFYCNAKIIMTLEGGSPVAMAKTTGIGITEFATAFDNLQPEVVVIRGDRYEVLSAVIAAAYMNITVAHIEGGDVSGTIDESVRHAVTKLAHLHFATNEQSYKRILRMGEDPQFVHIVGSPEVEMVAENRYEISDDYINYLGVGDAVDINKPYIIVMQHPVTTEWGKNLEHIEETLSAVHELQIPTIWFWPNVDAGTDEISKGIRMFRERYNPKHMRFIKYVPPEKFIGLLKGASCLVGNSSASIKECSYLGLPVVNIGTRQKKRLRAENVIDVTYDKKIIKQAIIKQISHGPYKSSTLYFKKETGKNIANILASVNLYTQKEFYE